MPRARRILFLCTGNACRSPMAEAWLRHLAEDRYASLSAGSHPAGFVHPLAVRVMTEVGLDISLHRSRGISAFLPPDPSSPDVIVSLCEFARRHCPRFPPEAGRIHWPIFDPILAQGNEDMRLSVFRGARDEIRLRIEQALDQGLFDHPPEAFEPPGLSRRLLGALRALARGRHRTGPSSSEPPPFQDLR